MASGVAGAEATGEGREAAATAAAATAAATEEFFQSIQAPSSTHPGISYPVRANPSLRCKAPHKGIGVKDLYKDFYREFYHI